MMNAIGFERFLFHSFSRHFETNRHPNAGNSGNGPAAVWPPQSHRSEPAKQQLKWKTQQKHHGKAGNVWSEWRKEHPCVFSLLKITHTKFCWPFWMHLFDSALLDYYILLPYGHTVCGHSFSPDRGAQLTQGSLRSSFRNA